MADRSQFTLYSGAHRGAESEFGKQASAGESGRSISLLRGMPRSGQGVSGCWGRRSSDKGMSAWNRLHPHGPQLFQGGQDPPRSSSPIFHMINNGYQVFAVGWIPAGWNRKRRHRLGR